MTRGQCQWLRLRSGTIYTVGAIYFQSVYRQGQGYGYSRKGEVKLRLIQKHRGPEPSYTVLSRMAHFSQTGLRLAWLHHSGESRSFVRDGSASESVNAVARAWIPRSPSGSLFRS